MGDEMESLRLPDATNEVHIQASRTCDTHIEQFIWYLWRVLQNPAETLQRKARNDDIRMSNVQMDLFLAYPLPIYFFIQMWMVNHAGYVAVEMIDAVY